MSSGEKFLQVTAVAYFACTFLSHHFSLSKFMVSLELYLLNLNFEEPFINAFPFPALQCCIVSNICFGSFVLFYLMYIICTYLHYMLTFTFLLLQTKIFSFTIKIVFKVIIVTGQEGRGAKLCS